MPTIVPLDRVVRRPRRVAIGNFDGVHLGHREVVKGADTVVTFDPHPAVVMRSGAAPPLLTTIGRRAEIFGELGVQEVVVIPFDRDFAARSVENFVDEVLLQRLETVSASVGEDFRFGRGGAGDAGCLLRDGRFATRVVPMLAHGGGPVSSSRIRALVEHGEFPAASALLGRPFDLEVEMLAAPTGSRRAGALTAVAPVEHVLPGGGGFEGQLIGPKGAVVDVVIWAADGSRELEIEMPADAAFRPARRVRLAFSAATSDRPYSATAF